MKTNKLTSRALFLIIGLIMGYFLHLNLYAEESLEEKEFFAARPSGIMSEEVKPGGIVKNTFIEEVKSETPEIKGRTDLVLLAEYKRKYDALKRYEESVDKIITIMSKNNAKQSVLNRYQIRRDFVHNKKVALYKEIMLEKKK